MTLKTNENDPKNRGRQEPEAELRLIWLGMRDSNPRSRDQNPLPYRLANPQCVVCGRSYSRCYEL